MFMSLIVMTLRAGQSHDGYFEFSRHGQVKHALGNAKLVSEKGVTTKDGTVYPADMVVFCGGCEYQGSPPFLAELKLGECPEVSCDTAPTRGHDKRRDC